MRRRCRRVLHWLVVHLLADKVVTEDDIHASKIM